MTEKLARIRKNFRLLYAFFLSLSGRMKKKRMKNGRITKGKKQIFGRTYKR